MDARARLTSDPRLEALYRTLDEIAQGAPKLEQLVEDVEAARVLFAGGPIELEQLPEDEAAIAITMMVLTKRRHEELVKNVNTITKNAKAAAAESPELAMQMFRAAKLLAPLRDPNRTSRWPRSASDI